MQLIFALLLIGATYATAYKICSRNVFDVCYSFDDPRAEDEYFLQTVEFLDEVVCQKMICSMFYENVCGSTDMSKNPLSVAAFRQARKIHKAICEKEGPMRLKYLETTKCGKQQSEIIGEKCNLTKGSIEPDLERDDPKFCPSVVENRRCILNEYRLRCGQDAADVNAVISPGPDFFGC